MLEGESGGGRVEEGARSCEEAVISRAGGVVIEVKVPWRCFLRRRSGLGLKCLTCGFVLAQEAHTTRTTNSVYR